MGHVSAAAWLLAGYGVLMILVAWAFDRIARRGAIRSAAWRTGNFVYHDDHDAWKCHEDQWLWPVSFDAEKRVIRYQGQHEICGRCPVKDTCSPTPGPRELTRPIDPWPHSETGRFHRGIALVVCLLGGLMPLVQIFDSHTPAEALLLGSVTVAAVALAAPLARHLWNQPVNYPEHLPTEAGPLVETTRPALPDVETLIDRYATTWRTERTTPSEKDTA
ncbi:hypothetical protein [Aestuariimicrobium sp. T2.26MG-19.2B]|uniref:hypothetical protein n=1 Tax=Aestuariimicrobium sp. T2.26MG-19.2B TaxID=3040679 RepID=UPI00247733DC|nr:hypothetical protein [Aestuariimicrobium sp. T2.26MG-19.2B]CAI9409145.1 hypothetical protein AESSP_02175 [Aestuariimicrobium sp. T2.26MG-19.2B]